MRAERSDALEARRRRLLRRWASTSWAYRMRLGAAEIWSGSFSWGVASAMVMVLMRLLVRQFLKTKKGHSNALSTRVGNAWKTGKQAQCWGLIYCNDSP